MKAKDRKEDKPFECKDSFESDVSISFWRGKRIDGIVFDVDGTLTDSIDAYFEVFEEATARVGIHVRKEDVLEPMATGSLIWERAISREIPDREKKIKQIMEAIPGIYFEVFQRVKPFSGLEPIFRELKKAGIRLGAHTSSWAVALRPLQNAGLGQYFVTTMSHEDGFPPKPAPEGIMECLRRMEVTPDHAIVVGDSPLDIRAGKAAGALTIGVLTGIGNRSQLEAESPAIIIKEVTEILSLLNIKEF